MNLGFNYGATLRDPDGVLVGSGKQVRHIKIFNDTDLRRSYVREFILEAIAQAGGPQQPAAGVPESQVRGNYPKKRRPVRKD